MKKAAVIADSGYGALKQRIIEHTGLAYYANKDEDLADRIARRLAATGIRGCAAYSQILEGGGAGEREMDELIAELTIGETYFFRQPEHFKALRDIVFPELIERNHATRELRIWSAGCATGAEPYSVAMLLRGEMAEATRGWHIRILGTDINRVFLARAREGVFDQWTFRQNGDELKERYFVHEGKKWALKPEFRQLATFEYHNLVTGACPPPRSLFPEFDLILCRNVMIYFSADVIRATAGKLHRCLADGGYLLVGHAELNTELFSEFETVSAPGVTLYRKSNAPERQRTGGSVRLPVSVDLGRTDTAAAVSGSLPAPGGRGHRSSRDRRRRNVAEIRRLADRGQWSAAASSCRRLLETDNGNAAAHFTLGLIQEHAGSVADAERSLKRAVDLDPGLALAHYHLGLLLQRRKDAAQAGEAFRKLLALLARKPDDEQLEHGDGISVAELRELTIMQMDLLGRA